MNTKKIIFFFVLGSLLAACGGGGSGGKATASSQPASSSSSVIASVSSVSSAVSSDAESSVTTTSSSSEASSDQSSSVPATGSLSCGAANTVQGFAAEGSGTTGGANGNYIVAKTGADLAAALASKKNNTTPLTIYVNGTITPENSGVVQFDVKDMENVSIIGVGTAALFDGIGINIVRANNVIVRNVTMRWVRIGQKDAISIDGTSTNVWIDHNELYNDLNTSKDYYDELVSGKGNIDNITISYNYIHDSWKTSLWGFNDSNDYDRHVTFYANRWENVNSRLPLFRFGHAHVWNNYYNNILETGINARMGAQVRIDGNLFENSKNPVLSKDSIEVGYWDFGDTDTNIYQDVTWYPATCTGAAVNTCAVAGPDVTNTTSYTPPYDYTIIPAAEVKNHVVDNAGVNKISRSCLGVPEDIVEGETGGGVVPDSGGSDGSERVVVAGGWTAEALTSGDSTSDITGNVGASSDTAVSFAIDGGKFESSKEAFYFVHQLAEGDFSFTARLTSWATTTRANSDQGSVGIMLCIDCENGSATASANVKIGLRNASATDDPGILHSQRLLPGEGVSKATITPAITPGTLYLRITRMGNAVTLSYSMNGGLSYAEARTASFAVIPEQVAVGLYAAQGTSDENAFTFEQISVITAGDD